MQLAFERLEQEKAQLAKEIKEFAHEKNEVYEDRRVLTMESISISYIIPFFYFFNLFLLGIILINICNNFEM